ncbi:eukaryotic cytochrome b561 domain protein [Metarhizium robertsii]|uniref:Cytochrome b561/ferric reductase transmembrane n=2 Tax=Metarhizium robertsii TaxID=568076 RepID=E9FD01_METRA|nr:Cytochrome b561/ferric reductase transmembrane [Metarhizium robertsii ARSEF 23]EFY94379.1 Cytochrome b561/ferric reductase transmembrane [Metarhizium robertsii ARSEF 23]EXU94891.1 eukaryotic cytochrome b561 domain protein [Metarhizium robertsii]
MASQFNPNIIYADLPKVPSLAKTHGILMGLTFAVILPLGALLIRIPNVKYGVWIHAGWQLIGWACMIAGMVMGIRMGNILDRLHNNAHTILGTIIVVALLIQPFLGYIHHRRFMKTQRKGIWTRIHVYYGRVLLILGIINGGLGLQLASDSPAYSRAGEIAYSVVAGVAGLMLLAIMAFTFRQSSKTAKT